MSQMTLFGEAAAPGPATDRLFFALFPDAATAARIADLARELRGECGLGGKPLATDRLHVTLIHIGDYGGLPQGVVAAAMQAAATIAAPSFEVCFDRVASFTGRPGHSPLVLRAAPQADELMGFQRVLVMALLKAGLRTKAGGFTPHVTLLYDRAPIAERAAPLIQWTAKAFVLVHSLIGRTRYIPLGRWPLY